MERVDRSVRVLVGGWRLDASEPALEVEARMELHVCINRTCDSDMYLDEKENGFA